MNLFTLYTKNLDWLLKDKIEVIVGGEEKGKMTLAQAIMLYKYNEVVGFNKTQVWLSARRRSEHERN